MIKDIQVGDTVLWNWIGGEETGTVVERYTEEVTVTIDGEEMTRQASEEMPAYLVARPDGRKMLRSAADLRPVDTD